MVTKAQIIEAVGRMRQHHDTATGRLVAELAEFDREKPSQASIRRIGALLRQMGAVLVDDVPLAKIVDLYVFGGTSTTAVEFPDCVAVQINVARVKFPKVGAGVAISADWVLTVSHLFDVGPPHRVIVGTDVTSLGGCEVFKVARHVRETSGSKLSLLCVDPPMSVAPTHGSYAGCPVPKSLAVHAVAYGSTTGTSSGFGYQRKADLTVDSADVEASGQTFITASAKDILLCHGDSGAPLFAGDSATGSPRTLMALAEHIDEDYCGAGTFVKITEEVASWVKSETSVDLAPVC